MDAISHCPPCAHPLNGDEREHPNDRPPGINDDIAWPAPPFVLLPPGSTRDVRAASSTLYHGGVTDRDANQSG